jgi:hypothetical protein
VDRDHALTAAFRLTNLEQPTVEIDVAPVEPEQLASAQPRVGKERDEQPIALALAGEVPLPDIVAFGRCEEPRHLALVEQVGERLALLRRAQNQRGVAVERLVLDTEAEEALERGHCARLASERRPPLGFGRKEAAEIGGPNQAQIVEPALV